MQSTLLLSFIAENNIRNALFNSATVRKISKKMPVYKSLYVVNLLFSFLIKILLHAS